MMPLMSDPNPDLPKRLAEAEREITRLRRLVGPCEKTYLDLRQDLLAARDATKGAEAKVGNLTGHMAELRLELDRARQERTLFQRVAARLYRAVMSRVRAVLHRFAP